MVSKMVVNRKKSSGIVCAAAASHQDNIRKAIAETLNEEAGAAAVTLLKASADRLSAATDEMFNADQAHQSEITDDSRLVEEKDEQTSKVREVLIDLREVAGTVYGDDFVSELGFKGPTPTDSMTLYSQGSLVVGKLETVTLPEAKRFGMTVDLTQFQTALPPMLSDLAEATAAVNEDKQDAADTMITRNNAMDTFDQTFSRTANLVSTLLKLANQDELAKRVRPSTRKPGLTIEEARDKTDTTPESIEESRAS